MLPFRPALIAALLLAVAPAANALTAEEVWADLQRLADLAEVPLTATARRQGDSLVLTDIRAAIGPPDQGAYLILARIQLRDQADGSVTIVLPDRFPITLDLPPTANSNDPDFLRFTAAAPDLSIRVAGLADKADYRIAAPSLSLTLDPISPKLPQGDSFAVTLAAADLALTFRQDLLSPTLTIAAEASLGTLHGEVEFDARSQASHGTIGFDLTALGGSIAATVPPSLRDQLDSKQDPDLHSLMNFLSDGLSLKAEAHHGGIALNGRVTEQAKSPIIFDFGSADGAVAARLDATELSYDAAIGASRFDTTLNDPTLDFTSIIFSFGEYAFGMRAGIGSLTDPQDAHLYYRLTEVVLPDEIWAEIDKKLALPHQPLSFALEMSARYALGAEMLLPGWTPDPDSFPPVDIVSVSLDRLFMSGAGAELTGNGAFSFDETDLTTFEGVPAPTGKLSFLATGIYGLLDRVASSGLLSPDELTGFRFGLAFIAKAGQTPDSLTSDFEVRDKTVYLNGQKLR